MIHFEGALPIELNFQAGTSMMDYEEQILQALNEAGRQATGHCLEQFDADGSPIVIGGVKLTSKSPVLKSYQTPFGETAVERHDYQSSEGGRPFARWISRRASSTVRLRVLRKCAPSSTRR